MLVWLSVCSKVQIVCIWSSWYHYIPQPQHQLASFKSRLVLPFWYQLTKVVLEKRPLNGCSLVVVVVVDCSLQQGIIWMMTKAMQYNLMKECCGVSENRHQVWQTEMCDFVHVWIHKHFKRPTAPHRLNTTRSTQSCIPPGWLNQCWGKVRNVTSARWQVTLCDPMRHVSSRSGEASCKLLYFVYFTYFTHWH